VDVWPGMMRLRIVRRVGLEHTVRRDSRPGKETDASKR
jgi:hypothetical protein